MSDSRVRFAVPDAESEDDADAIEGALSELRGVQAANVDPESGDVEVRYGKELLSEEEIRSAVREAGYEVE